MKSSAEPSTDLRHIRLQLAREPDHPEGDPLHGYDVLAPLTETGRLDASAWKRDPAACRVRRFRPGEDDANGHLARKPGGQWIFRYDRADEEAESGFRFGDETFAPGEYVSIKEDDAKFHTFKVVSVKPL
jgi:hypothetical protein